MSFASSKLSTETLGRGLGLLDRGMSALDGMVKQELDDDDEEKELQRQIEEPFYQNSKCVSRVSFFHDISVCSFLPNMHQIIVLTAIFMNLFLPELLFKDILEFPYLVCRIDPVFEYHLVYP